LNTFQTALVYVPSGIAVLVASPLFGVLVTRRGAKNTLVFASFIVAASFVFFALAGSSIVGIIIGTVILFSGVGGVFVAAINLLFLYVPASRTGAETALNMVFRYIGGAVGTTVTGALLTLYAAPIVVTIPGGTTIALAPTTQAFTYVVVVALVLGLLGLVVAYALKRAPDVQILEGSDGQVPVG
jgi:MFS family permease